MAKQKSHGVFLPTGSSIYYCTARVGGVKRGVSTGHRSKKDATAFARNWKASLLSEVRAVQFPPSVPPVPAAQDAEPKMLFLDAVNRYMKEAGEGLVATDQYEVFFDWLVDRIGAETPLSAITNDTVARLMNEKACEYRFGDPKKGLVAATYVQRAVLVPLRTVLTRAKDRWDVHLPKEPSWGRHKVKFRFRTRVMSWDEEAAIKAVADPDLWRVVEYVLFTGVRRENALTAWSDVDRVGRVIRMTIKGERPFEVRITAGIRDLLEEAAETGGQSEEVWTWVPSRGPRIGVRKPLTYAMFQVLWKAATAKAGVRNLTIHDLRRTAGERMYRATGDIAAVSAFLGHTSVELTKRYYVHVKPDDVEERQLVMEWARSKSLEEHARRPRRRLR